MNFQISIVEMRHFAQFVQLYQLIMWFDEIMFPSYTDISLKVVLPKVYTVNYERARDYCLFSPLNTKLFL